MQRMNMNFVLMDLNVIFEIFSNFSRSELVDLFSVCKRWAELSESDALWGVMARNIYGVDAKIASKGRGGRQLYDSFYYSKISPLGLISESMGHPQLINTHKERKRAKRVCKRVGIETFYIHNLISGKYHRGFYYDSRDCWEVIDSDRTSHFQKVIGMAHIKTIQITGHTFSKAKGVHKVIWRMKVLSDCLNLADIHFTVSSPNSPNFIHYVWSFNPQHPENVDDNILLAFHNIEWFDLEIGRINLQNVGDKVTFEINQFTGEPKTGLLIDYVQLLPTN